jgi:hypothetical protein
VIVTWATGIYTDLLHTVYMAPDIRQRVRPAGDHNELVVSASRSPLPLDRFDDGYESPEAFAPMMSDRRAARTNPSFQVSDGKHADANYSMLNFPRFLMHMRGQMLQHAFDKKSLETFARLNMEAIRNAKITEMEAIRFSKITPEAANRIALDANTRTNVEFYTTKAKELICCAAVILFIRLAYGSPAARQVARELHEWFGVFVRESTRITYEYLSTAGNVGEFANEVTDAATDAVWLIKNPKLAFTRFFRDHWARYQGYKDIADMEDDNPEPRWVRYHVSDTNEPIAAAEDPRGYMFPSRATSGGPDPETIKIIGEMIEMLDQLLDEEDLSEL